eukprot:TRINITY_DN74501_c0_g1_i1.p1 TRINITY_DN74501_c0_g1~~TRINITY_DN74501_c0_g1_i1.p1  ORF type:complete len:219 (+),score=53.10 TRINITY_DN74501_c0_g1_i1:92-748(+)
MNFYRGLATLLLACGCASDKVDGEQQLHSGRLMRKQWADVQPHDRHPLAEEFGSLVPGIAGDRPKAPTSLLEVTANASADLGRAGPLGGDNGMLYSIKALGLYCSDSGGAPVKCDQRNMGTWETFHIFHFSKRPDLHVIRGGHSYKWCRDHGLNIKCSHEDLTESEQFKIVSVGASKALRGPEHDRWCEVKAFGMIACNAAALTDGESQKFVIEHLPL